MSIRNRVGKLEKVSFDGEPNWSPQFETDATGSLMAGEFPEVGLARLVRSECEYEEDFRNRVYLAISSATAGMSEEVYRKLTTVTLERCLAALERRIAKHDPSALAELRERGLLDL